MTPRTIACIVVTLFIGAAAASAGGPLEVRGDALGPDGLLAAGPIAIRGDSVASTHTVLVVQAPVLQGTAFAVRGQLRTVDVEGEGYLEMWTHFPDGSRYFSRTLADGGPQAKFGGSSVRPFLLPFQSGPEAPAPARFEINVVMPGPGRVELTDVHYVAGADLAGASAAGAWWPDRTGGWIGAAFGVVFGTAAGLIALLVTLGKARRTAMALLNGALAVGVAGLLSGVTALSLGQPYAVFYPLLLGGLIALPLALLARRTAQQRYEANEFRRMRAMDLG